MITYLKVRNLAIVEEFAIEPGPGLNVLTGETGAGKSLLIDSLDFLRGARGSSEAVRTGADRMLAEAIFALPPESRELLEGMGVDSQEAEGSVELIIHRELSEQGRGRVLANGTPITVRDLSAAMEQIVDIHGQNQAADRIAGKSLRDLLDEFADLDDLREEVRNAHALWKAQAAELEALSASEKDRALRLDLLRYQIDEISAARLDTSEEESILAERMVLSHAQEVISAAAGAFQLLEDDEGSAISMIGRSEHLLEGLSGKIAEIGQSYSELRDVRFRLQEIARTLASIGDSVRHDPDRLEELEERLAAIERIKRKYGGSVEAALEHLRRSREEFDRLSDYEANLTKLQLRERERFDSYEGFARKLSACRRGAAAKLEKAVQQELRDLAMELTTVEVTVGRSAEQGSRLVVEGIATAFGPEGFDRVGLLIAPNRGEEPRPMQKIASGGELSRVQLAIAAALFKQSRRAASATLVFDEIDAGIGGRVAEVIGRKLRELAAENQVICVTHLPQIASMGTTHFRVWKEHADAHTRAKISRLDSGEERIEEIARMLAGETITESARAHASQLLRAAHTDRNRKARTSGAVSGSR